MTSAGSRPFFILLMILAFAYVPSASAADWSLDTTSFDGQWDFRLINGAFTIDQIHDDKSTPTQTINVPANWFLAGIEHGGTAIYQKEFSVEKPRKGQSYFIHFQGVDYAADIWLNDKYIGSHQGYFQPFKFDITTHIKPGHNILKVAVHSPNEEVGSVWSLRKQLIKGIFNHHDTRPGGAWSAKGQDKNTGGIWASVSLQRTGPASFDKLKVKTSFDRDKLGTVSLEFNLAGSNPASANAVELRITPKNFSGRSVTTTARLKKNRHGQYTVSFDAGQVRLWWPYELGAPNLYELEATIIAQNAPSDTVRQTIGFRTVERDRNSGVWRINGKKYFLRGTNYIATQWLAEMSNEDYDVDFALMRGAHINTVRVHAHIGAKPLYEAADRIGMLIWQDFPLQWGYDESDAFLREAKSQAADMVEHLNNHPSIIAWSMQNEPPWDADWMQYKYEDYDPEHNKTLTYELYATVLALDGTRHVHSHSATAEHPWLGWYSGTWLDYAKPTDQSLVTEFGAQALPNEEGLRRIFPEKSLFPDTEEDWKLWAYHNFQKHELTTIAHVEIGNNVKEFIENTQSYQAILTKFAAENLRRQKYRPVGGAFQFMFNEDWPSVNWGIVDYWRNPKPGYYALKSAYQPILASLEWKNNKFNSGDDIEVGLWIINDLYDTYENVTFSLTLRTPTEVLDLDHYKIDINADEARKFATWQRTIFDRGEYVLIAHIKDTKGELLSVNSFEFTIE